MILAVRVYQFIGLWASLTIVSDFLGAEIPPHLFGIILTLGIVFSAVMSLFSALRRIRWWDYQNWIIALTPSAIALIFGLILLRPVTDIPATFWIYPHLLAEDNSKWLSGLSLYALNDGDAWNSVTIAVLAVPIVVLHLLRFAQTIGLTDLLNINFSPGTPGEATTVLTITSWLVALSSPLFLKPVLKVPPDNEFEGLNCTLPYKQKKPLSYQFGVALMCGALLLNAQLLAASSGHLSAQIFMLGLVMWLGSSMGLGKERHDAEKRIIDASLLLYATTLWLGFQLFSAAISIAVLIAFCVSCLTRSRPWVVDKIEFSRALVFNSLFALALCVDALKYVLSNGRLTSLAQASGGTSSASTQFLLLAFASFGLFAYTASSSKIAAESKEVTPNVWVIRLSGVLLCSVLLLRANDVRATGGFSYGSTKALWMVFSVLVPFALAFLLMQTGQAHKHLKDLGTIRKGVVLLLLFTMLSDPQLLSVVKLLDPGRYASVVELDQVRSGENLVKNPAFYEMSGLVDTNIDQLPIGCLSLPVKELPDVPNGISLLEIVEPAPSTAAHTCSRFLGALSGTEFKQEGFILFNLGRLEWSELSENFPRSLTERDVVLLDSEGGVLKIASLEDVRSEPLSLRPLDARCCVELKPAPIGYVDVFEYNETTQQLDVSGWAPLDTVEYLAPSIGPASAVSSSRVTREDVEEIYGTEYKYAGFHFTITMPVDPTTKCFVFRSGNGEYFTFAGFDAC